MFHFMPDENHHFRWTVGVFGRVRCANRLKRFPPHNIGADVEYAVMKHVTRAVQPEDLGDLLMRPPRATLAFVSDGTIQALPVAFRYENGRYLVGLPAGMEPPVGAVKLLVDDGRWYFDLRGFWVRGTLAACQTPASTTDGSAWFELTPQKTIAWHYGRMREK